MTMRDDGEWQIPPRQQHRASDGKRASRMPHSPFIKNGRPVDLQPLETIDPIALHDLPVPERRWIAPELIPEGNVTMLGGDGGHGKTLLTLQLLVACALGQRWLGLPARRCKVVGVFCEDDRDELHRRLADVLRYYGASFGDLEDMTLLSRVADANLLMTFSDQWREGEPTAFFAQLERLTRERGAELLVLDSLHDFFGGNENSRTHARQFINQLREIAILTKGGVVLTAHPSLSGRAMGTGEAGSTAWNNAVRSRLYLTAPRQDDREQPDRDYRELRTMKANYGARGGVLKLRWRDGVFTRDDEPTGIIGSINRRSADDAFLACLDAAAAQGRHVTDANNSPRYAPKVFASMPQADGITKDQLQAAMARLFNAGKIVIGSITGPDRHPAKAIVRTSNAAAGSAGSPFVTN
jgi:RecA-family ATPase